MAAEEIKQLGLIGDSRNFGIIVNALTYEDGTRSIEVEVFGHHERQSFYINDLAEIESLIALLQRGKDHIQNG